MDPLTLPTIYSNALVYEIVLPGTLSQGPSTEGGTRKRSRGRYSCEDMLSVTALF